jgi:hypothetical protein
LLFKIMHVIILLTFRDLGKKKDEEINQHISQL